MEDTTDKPKDVYLGEWKDYSLYYKEVEGKPTVIGRYTGGFTSGLENVLNIPALAVAEERAIRAGYLPVPTKKGGL